jgi:succinate dehydrogenase assembly factor 1
MKSGLQKRVLFLYKSFLKEVSRKPIESQENFKKMIKTQFRKDSKVSKNEFEAIEYLIRKGEKQLNLLKNPQTTSITNG